MKKISKSMQQELTTLAEKPEYEVDLSDISATTEHDQACAESGKCYCPIKQQLTMRVDADVLAWLKGQGKGYKSRLNDILRAAMLEQTRYQ